MNAAMNRWMGGLCLTLLAPAAWAADICGPLREQIEMQIASTGTTGFAVIVVDANAEVAGKVVGTCAQGMRKLVYVRGARAGGAADNTGLGASANRPPARQGQTGRVAPAPDDGIITECRDGTEVRGAAICQP